MNELQRLKDEIADLLEQTDGAMAAFFFAGKCWSFDPPADEEVGYALLAVQVKTLAQVYKKSPLVVMAEVNCALKRVIK